MSDFEKRLIGWSVWGLICAHLALREIVLGILFGVPAATFDAWWSRRDR